MDSSVGNLRRTHSLKSHRPSAVVSRPPSPPALGRRWNSRQTQTLASLSLSLSLSPSLSLSHGNPYRLQHNRHLATTLRQPSIHTQIDTPRHRGALHGCHSHYRFVATVIQRRHGPDMPRRLLPLPHVPFITTITTTTTTTATTPTTTSCITITIAVYGL
jgi:hypothetical protein